MKNISLTPKQKVMNALHGLDVDKVPFTVYDTGTVTKPYSHLYGNRTVLLGMDGQPG